MSEDSDHLDRLIVTVVSLRRRFGTRMYRSAILAARQAVAALVLKEAERRARLSGRPPEKCVIIEFPGSRTTSRRKPVRRPSGSPIPSERGKMEYSRGSPGNRSPHYRSSRGDGWIPFNTWKGARVMLVVMSNQAITYRALRREERRRKPAGGRLDLPQV